jgi:pimeloyl-ACP methyl ester carboxylesterase
MWPEPSLPFSAVGCCAASADDGPTLLRLRDDAKQRYWLYCPAHAPARFAPVLVSVHGISRNAAAHARALAGVADALGCVLVAPHFSRRRFPDYQRLGRPDRLGIGGRADTMLLRIVDDVRARLGLAPQPFGLLGHSGGAQFAQRFALVHARHLAGYALSAAGSYAWPDRTRRFPHGLAMSPRFADLQPDLDATLRLPGLLLVGGLDIERDPALRQGARIDAEQGRTRLERAQRFIASMRQRAAERGSVARLRPVIVPDCAHGFSALAQAPLWRSEVLQHFRAAFEDRAIRS